MECTNKSTLTTVPSEQKSHSTDTPETFIDENVVTLSYILSGVSIISLLVRLILQKIISNFKNLGGKLQCILSISLLLFYISFIIVQATTSAAAVAFTTWAFLFYFSTANAVSVHLYNAICKALETRSVSKTRKCIFFIIHSLIPPSLLTMIVIVLDFTLDSGDWYPGLGECGPRICGKYVTGVIVLVPIAVILTSNFVLFWKIMKSSTESITRASISRSMRSQAQRSKRQDNKAMACLIVRLLSLMGLPWLVTLLRLFSDSLLFDYLVTIAVTSQGLLLLLVSLSGIKRKSKKIPNSGTISQRSTTASTSA